MNKIVKTVLGIFLVLSFVLQDTYLYAKTDDSPKVLKAYRKYSLEYASLGFEVEAKKIQYQLYKERYDAALEKEKSYELANLEASTRDALLLSTQENWLSMQDYLFYEENGDAIIKVERSKKENELLAKYYQLTVTEAYAKYYQAVKEQYAYDLSVQKKKKRLGYGNSESIKTIQQNISDLKDVTEDLEQERETMISDILEETRLKSFRIASGLPVSFKVKSQKEYENKFMEQAEYKSYAWKIDLYKQYSSNLVEKLSDSKSFEKYCNNQIDMIRAEQTAQKKTISTNVKKLLKQYQKATVSVQRCKDKIKEINQKIEKCKKAYKEGFSRKSDLLELRSEKEKLNVELISNRYDRLMIYYQLEY